MNNNYYSGGGGYFPQPPDPEEQWDGLNYHGDRGNPDIPDYIYAAHPDAEFVPPDSGMVTLVATTLFSLIVIGISVIFFIMGMYEAKETEEFFAHAVEVPGYVHNSWESIRGSGKTRHSVLMVTYAYEYDGFEYSDTAELGSLEARSLGLIKRPFKNKPLTIYVNPDLPSQSRLLHTSPYLHYLWLSGVLLGFFAWIAALHQHIMYKSGRVIRYKKNKTYKYITLRKSQLKH